MSPWAVCVVGLYLCERESYLPFLEDLSIARHFIFTAIYSFKKGGRSSVSSCIIIGLLCLYIAYDNPGLPFALSHVVEPVCVHRQSWPTAGVTRVLGT